MTMIKIRNPSHSKQALHTVDGVRHIGPRRTRDYNLSAAGLKLVKSSDVLEIIEPEKSKPKSTQKPVETETVSEATDVHGEGDSTTAGRSDAGGGAA